MNVPDMEAPVKKSSSPDPGDVALQGVLHLPRPEAAMHLGVCPQTISRYRKRRKQGLPLVGKCRGRRPTLRGDQVRELADVLAETRQLIRIQNVIQEAHRRFGVYLSRSTAQRLLASHLVRLRPDLWCLASSRKRGLAAD